MTPEDYAEPELYDRRDVLILQRQKRVDYALNELQGFCNRKRWQSELVVRLCELHLAESRAK